MKKTRFISGFTATLKKHKFLVFTALILAVVVALTKVDFRGALVGLSGPGVSSSSEDSLRTCSDAGTMFEGMNNLTAVMKKYHEKVSGVVKERQQYFERPDLWKCTEPESMPELSSLASRLPGWHYPDGSAALSGQNYKLRPVLFESFASVLAEYLREYECKLVRLQQADIDAVISNNDIDQPCGGVGLSSCPGTTIRDLATRPETFSDKISVERHRARVALERTLHVLRSYEMNYAAARNLICLHRASMDFRAEMSLIADATSCMPKIWDAVTSIHDRKYK
ncbi:hypothetical protein A3A67_02410 [Candidatus Peribacteria bacterium RIFCSPLOWO2_01_FULL_51_18]|nr:MAG: hypothetical protein A3C52_04810 [Candidatus Peribacteria bacterium RIFCSPHIGHO2_02_FULL_51_15]OGJ66866.1 MAG: hypothetical protein A3A67_02410 [Candidatus Peribacteria bacterium RIFCSPLOWO2_01_FULL_51_18]OGJ69668.1 MAG: hypothetical protein A3J34_02810 [Candidatus Peribacteria bacterium RIFCSPLOWO2_02_FULL_51_10]